MRFTVAVFHHPGVIWGGCFFEEVLEQLREALQNKRGQVWQFANHMGMGEKMLRGERQQEVLINIL